MDRRDQRLLDGFVAFVDLVGVMFELVAHQPTDDVAQRAELVVGGVGERSADVVP